MIDTADLETLGHAVNIYLFYNISNNENNQKELILFTDYATCTYPYL